MNLVFLGRRVQSSLRIEPLSFHPGFLLFFSNLYLSHLISVSLKHSDKTSKGTMTSANSPLSRYHSFLGSPTTKLFIGFVSLGKLSGKIHIKGNKGNKGIC